MISAFDGISDIDLLGSLPTNVRSSIQSLEKAGADWDTVGALLANTPAIGVALKGVNWKHTLWQAVKAEFHSLVCTESEVYKDLREQWKSLVKGGPSVLTASIAGAVGAKLGVASGVLLPVVIWLCVAFARIGKQSLCGLLLPPALPAGTPPA